MPITPLHLGIVWPIFMTSKHKLHFMCLSFGAMVPDLEVLIMAPFTTDLGHARGLMHSFYGAVTVDIVVVLIIAYLFIPPIGRWLSKRKGTRWHIFAGVDITMAPSDLRWAVSSALIGTLSHVTIDLFTHRYNPIFFPYLVGRDVHIIPFDDATISNLMFSIPLLIIIIVMMALYWTKKR